MDTSPQPTPEQSPVSTDTPEAYQTPGDSQTTDKLDLAQPFSWHAPEGAQVARGTLWYVLFGVVALGLLALAILVFKSITFAILLVVMIASVVTLTGKTPRTINYGISPKGIYVGDRLHDYSEFRAFGVVQDPGFLSIIVLPVKRFSPGLTLYFDEADGEKIVDMLGARLPLQEVKPDVLEKLIRFIRL